MRVCVLDSIGLLAGVVPLSAQFLPCAADTHLTRKGDYLNGTTAVVDSGVWEWEIGSGDTYTSIQGISAVGMFYATVPTSIPAPTVSPPVLRCNRKIPPTAPLAPSSMHGGWRSSRIHTTSSTTT